MFHSQRNTRRVFLGHLPPKSARHLTTLFRLRLHFYGLEGLFDIGVLLPKVFERCAGEDTHSLRTAMLP